MQRIMFHGRLDYFQEPLLGGRPKPGDTKPGDHATPNAHNHWFILLYHVWERTWIKIHWSSIWWRASHIWFHTTFEDPWPHYMILKASWNGLWILSFGFSQFHGHGSWLMCEVTLRWKCEINLETLNWSSQHALVGNIKINKLILKKKPALNFPS